MSATAELLGRFEDPERAHAWAAEFLKLLGIPGIRNLASLVTRIQNPRLKQRVLGIDFENPVGLAGGFDKKGTLVRGLESLGFGFVEVGSITQLPQDGNDRPRIFKSPRDKAIVNWMGMNSVGADAMQKTLARTNNQEPLGVSLGKSKNTPQEHAADDYMYSFAKLYQHGNYFAVNVSSPNTPGLRALQDKDALVAIVSKMNAYRNRQKERKPILVKVAPDLTNEALDEVLGVIKEHGIDGIIATNTTTSREGLTVPAPEKGGMSGAPLKNRSTEFIRYIHKKMPELPIIGVGGIFTAEDAYEKIRAGASLVQIYSGFIYGGPMTPKRINKDLARLLKRDGFVSVADAVGKG